MPEPTVPLTFSADSIVDTVREPLLVLGADLKVWRANRSFYRTFAVTPEETIDRLVYDLGNGQWDIPRLRTLLEEILPQNTSFDDFEVTHEFPSIGRKVMLLNARRLYREPNSTEFILLAFEDITERRRLEDERRELEVRFTSLVKNIRDHSIFTLDPQGHITSWNREAEKILGYTETEVLGQHFSTIFTPEDREAGVPAQELSTAMSEGRAEDERWHMRKNGQRFWALGIVTPTQDASGAHTGYSKILRDMTDRKRAEEGLHQADKRKDEFLATLAHELRNPLAPIRNGLQLLRLTTDPATWAQAREMMERQLAQMVRLVDDLLDISRITRNKLELRKAPVELWAVVQSAVETARPQIEASGHTLTVTLPPQPIHLNADLTRLAQVFWNLLNNSAKYTEPGGRISLVAEMQGGEAVVTVQDNGIGLAAESMPGLFEIFSQVDRSLERAQGGLGIGLALVKGLTEAHGGRVEARSDGVGRGSTFIVRLPVTERKPPAGRPQADATQPASQGRILVVDDNRDGAASLAMLLTVMGNDTRTAHDGLEGVELAEAFRPDLIVLDIGLPKLNGYDACRRIREKPWAKDTLIVAATGWGQDDDRRRSKEAGGGRRTQPLAGREEDMKPGSARFDYSLDFKTTDFRQRPDLYRIGKGEQGGLLVKPYKGEILPHWRFKTVAKAKKSSAKIYRMFLAYLKAEDIPGADMAHKFLQMGWTRARRYANHRGGHAGPPEGLAHPRHEAQVALGLHFIALRNHTHSVIAQYAHRLAC